MYRLFKYNILRENHFNGDFKVRLIMKRSYLFPRNNRIYLGIVSTRENYE